MKKIILAALALAGLCACSSDDVIESSKIQEADGVYVKFNLSMADVTRATTESSTDNDGDYVKSSDGEEYGQSYENTVSSLSIVLTDGTSSVVASVSNPTQVSSDTYVVCFKDNEITSLASQDVNVYIYCNQNVSSFDKDATSSSTPWTENAFYMSNAVEHTASLPSATEMSEYNSEANPLDLGVVRVERSMARFDYKDGATSGTAFTYPIVTNDDEEVLVNLVLTDVALINMSNSFYLLRHMAESADATAENPVADLNNITILNTEYNNNWVIDTDASDKINYTGTGLTSNFTYPLETPSTWGWTSLSDLSTPDDNDTWNSDNSKGNYYIWRYANENTIPSVDAQLKGIITGVVFKGELVPTEESGITLGGADGGRVYVYENTLYESWDAVEAAVEDADGSTTLADAYKLVMEVWDAQEPGTTEYDATVTAAMATAGFTGYSPDEDGNYYVYYYYWNQHNNNGVDGVMGIMEYAVVRNNVYKLSVTDITGFGHPTPKDSDDPNPDPDPDPVDPEDPVETQDIYLKVDVEILPWVVRVNDITF